MSTAARLQSVPILEPGDKMTQAEFHRRYEAYPEDVKCELIGGIVYMASPLRRPHGVHHPELSGVFWLYKGGTPGIEVLDNATTILGDESEPQPDLALRIFPSSAAGRSKREKTTSKARPNTWEKSLKARAELICTSRKPIMNRQVSWSTSCSASKKENCTGSISNRGGRSSPIGKVSTIHESSPACGSTGRRFWHGTRPTSSKLFSRDWQVRSMPRSSSDCKPLTPAVHGSDKTGIPLQISPICFIGDTGCIVSWSLSVLAFTSCCWR